MSNGDLSIHICVAFYNHLVLYVCMEDAVDRSSGPIVSGQIARLSGKEFDVKDNSYIIFEGTISNVSIYGMSEESVIKMYGRNRAGLFKNAWTP